VAEILLAIKYGGRSELAHPIGRAMAAIAAVEERAADTIVVPVPTTAPRFRSRGYNPAALLASTIAAQLGLPLASRLLRRTHDRGSMGGLGRDARRAQVAGSFVASPKVAGKEILLIDDVFTTGATLSECARVLKASGALRVNAITAAGVSFETD